MSRIKFSMLFAAMTAMGMAMQSDARKLRESLRRGRGGRRGSSSKFMPHQGAREIARRKRQIASGMLKPYVAPDTKRGEA